jgi:hypothetical protein
MKTKHIALSVLLASLAFLIAPSSHAGVTNITAKLTTEIAGDSTNSVSIKFQQDGSAKDALTVDSLVWYFNYAKSSGLTTNDFTGWLKDTTKGALQSHVAEKSANDLGAAMAKVSAAAATDASLLSTTQKNQIIAIAASLP